MMKGFKKLSAFLLSAVMLVGVLVGVPAGDVQAKGDGPEGYILIHDYAVPDGEMISTEKYLYSYWDVQPSDYQNPYGGISYEISTNTLTLSNYKNPKLTISLDGMGKNFRIVLVGDNAVGCINAMRTGITIDGKGTLTVNSEKKEHCSIMLNGTQAPPFEVAEDYYVDSTLHIGPDATVTLYSEKQDEGGVNVEAIWCVSSNIKDVINYDGKVSEELKYETNTNKGTEQYDYYNNSTYAYHTVSADNLYKDDANNIYLKCLDAGYTSDYQKLEKHNNKWFLSPAITYGSNIENIEKYTENIPEDLLVSAGNIGIYQGIRYSDYEDPETKQNFALLYGYQKGNDGKTYVIMPKKSLSWDNDSAFENVDYYCISEITKSGESFELDYNWVEPWTMSVTSVTDVESVKNYTQAVEYMAKQGYTKKGYKTPDSYEFIVTNDVLVFSPKKEEATTQAPTTEAPKTEKTTEAPTVATGASATDSTGATITVTSTEGGKVEAEYKPAETTDKKVTVPSTTVVNGVETTITSIADDAFSGNKTVTEVTLPETIEEIGDNAFKGCTKLKKITIPKNVEEVGKNAFAGCSSLTSVTIKSTTIKKIEQGAFKNCSKLTKITITKSVTTISKDAFSGDKKLKTITIKSKNIKSVGKNAFKGVPKNATIKVPAKQKKAYAKLFKKAGFKGKVK